MPISNASELLGKINKKAFVVHEALEKFFFECNTVDLGRLIFVEKGVIHIKVVGKQLLVPPGYCAWIPANTQHEIWANTNDVFLRNVYFESSFCKDPCFHFMAIFNCSNLYSSMIRHTLKWSGLVEEDDSELTFTRVLRQMMPEEMKSAFAVSLPSTDHPQLQEVLTYIHDNYENSVKVNDLAKVSNMSLRSLQRLFNTETGISFSSYVKLIRIIKAVELLSTTKMRISEVAWDVGYNSIPTFTNTFKELTGQRPDYFQNNSSKLLSKTKK